MTLTRAATACLPPRLVVHDPAVQNRRRARCGRLAGPLERMPESARVEGLAQAPGIGAHVRAPSLSPTTVIHVPPVRRYRAPAAGAWPWAGPSGTRCRSAGAPPSLSGGPRHALGRGLAGRTCSGGGDVVHRAGAHRRQLHRAPLRAQARRAGAARSTPARRRGSPAAFFSPRPGTASRATSPAMDDARRRKEPVLHEPLDQLRTRRRGTRREPRGRGPTPPRRAGAPPRPRLRS